MTLGFELLEDRYDGPHGPMTVSPRRHAGRSTVLTPHGEAAIAWSRGQADEGELDGEGIAVHVAGAPEACLRRTGRALALSDLDGTPRTVLRRRFGRLRLERPDGTPLATWRGRRGRVTDHAEFADVVLMLLVMASRVDQQLDRPALTLA